MIPRRHFLRGLGLLLAAPAIVRVGSIMPVRAVPIASVALPADPWWDTRAIGEFWLASNGVEWVKIPLDHP